MEGGKEPFYVNGIVEEILSRKGSDMKLLIKYYEDGEEKTERINYPDNNVKKCG